jgi:hypothetical protein
MPWLTQISLGIGALGFMSRTRRVLLGDSKFRCGALACHRRCPWWSTWESVSAVPRMRGGRRLTSTCQTRSCSKPMTVPASRSASCCLRIHRMCRLLTGPTRSGMYSSSSTTFPSMKKKPNNVTRFGAIHSGRSSTKPFHCAGVRSCCDARIRGSVRSV